MPNYNKTQACEKIALMSIKPIYAHALMCGEKRVEFRRRWTKEDVRKILVYASAPDQSFLGFMQVEEVVCAEIAQLISINRMYNGKISDEDLTAYFHGRTKGYAIIIGEVKRFEAPLHAKTILHNFAPPQSYRWLTAEVRRKIECSQSV